MGNEKKEYAVGEVFRHTDGKAYRCVEGETCEGCAFGLGGYRCSECCGPRWRTDGRSVIFTEVTKPVDGMLYRAENGRMYRLAEGSHYDHQCACDTAPSLGCSALDRAVFKTPLLDWYWAPVEEDAPVEPPKPVESPKRHIELAVVKVEDDNVTFRIVEQTRRCNGFSRQNNPRKFTAANGFQLRSAANPEWGSDTSTLYCRGYRGDRDNIELTCTAGEFSRICAAISEYNSTDGKGCEPRWPQKGDRGFFVTAFGTICQCVFDGVYFDCMMQDFGNFFRTEAEAKAALERVKQALKK